MACTLKHVHDTCVNPFVETLIPKLKVLEGLGESSYINTTLTYVTTVANTTNKDELIQSIRKLESVNEEKVMTLAEHFRQEGREEVMTLAEHFRQEGLEKGIEKGIDKGVEKVARSMLADGMEIGRVAALTGLSKKRIKELSH